MGRPKKEILDGIDIGEHLVSGQDLTRLSALALDEASAFGQVQQSTIDSDYMKSCEWQSHPEYFMTEALGFSPWTCPDADDQLDIVHAIRDYPRVTVKSGNGVGKTAIAARIVLWFLTCHYPSIVVTTAPTTRQVEKLLWGEIRSAYRTAKLDIGGEMLTTELRFEEMWYAIGFATDEKEKFQGFHSPHILIVVDEASGVSEAIFEAIEGVLTSENARILLIGNPTDPGSYFGRTFLNPREREGWKHLHISCYNSPNVRAGKLLVPALCAPKWPDAKLRQWGKYNPFYQVRVLGEFPDAGENNLVPYHMVHDALQRSIPPVGRKVLGVDVAWFGQDACVISRLWGEQFRVLKKLYNLDGPALADKIMMQLDAAGNEDIKEIRIDVIGFGASCYDALKGKKTRGSDLERKKLKEIKVIKVNVAEKSKSKEAQKNYKNLRAETAFAIREMFESNQVDIEDEDLAVQLANIEYKYIEGRQTLEKKEDYKKRMQSRSPDEFDSFIMAKAITRGAAPSVW